MEGNIYPSFTGQLSSEASWLLSKAFLVSHQPTNYDFYRVSLACCVYDVYCSVQTMLFIYIATAATFLLL